LNSQPQILTRGERNTQKIIGAISLYTSQFVYCHQAEYFNGPSYIRFLDKCLLPSFYKRGHRIYLIQDNASYHKRPELYEWFSDHRKYIEVFLLPPYSPEFNAEERVWWYTRLHATHNRYFENPDLLCNALFATFRDVQRHPEKLAGLMRPFF